MPDTFGVYDDMKVWEYLDFFARCYGITADRRRRVVADLLELVDLGVKRDAYVVDLSRGMQQRLCLAHALVHDPAVLLLDEPASGLDPRARVELRELLRELRALGKTIIISSHILPELEELCTSVAIIDRGRVLAAGRVADIEQRLRQGAVMRAHVLGDPATVDRAVAGSRSRGGRRDPASGWAHRDRLPRRRRRRVASPGRGDRRGLPRRHVRPFRERPRRALPPGHRTRRADRAGGRGCGCGWERRMSASTAPMARSRAAAAAVRRRRRLAGGIAAIGTKELRGRMRGRRAFLILTGYLVLLGVFAWMVFLYLERYYSQALGTLPTASAEIGRGIFGALMLLETMLVALLAPAVTAGAISGERERQTLGMLAATPISSLAIVVGKLLSALTYVFLLIAASIPLTALVFVFGGVGPDDVVRGYAVLLVTAIGFGAVGLACSAIMRRTQAAIIVAYAIVLVVTMGTRGMFLFWLQMNQVGGGVTRDVAPGLVQSAHPPEALMWLNPFFAQLDVICGTETGFSETCRLMSETTGRDLFGVGVTLDTKGGTDEAPPPVNVQPVPDAPVDGGVLERPAQGALVGPLPGTVLVVAEARRDVSITVDDEPPLDDTTGEGGGVTAPFGTLRDTLWPQFAASWLAISALLTLVSVQLVAPTRRWRHTCPAAAGRAPGVPRDTASRSLRSWVDPPETHGPIDLPGS
jgi:ABC-type transport system involved in multi-copper enzyme maturation permease subunit